MSQNFLQPYYNFIKNYTFLDKPILLGGGAMQHYSIRTCGYDLDMIISQRDKEILKKKGYELNLFGGETEKDVDSTFSNILDLHLDLVITLNQYDYDFFLDKAVEYPPENSLLIISLEDLLLTKIFAQTYSDFPKHKKDVELLIKGIEKKQYPHLHESLKND